METPKAPAITQATRDYVRAVALRIVKDPVDAEDVAQDALLLAYRYREAFRGDSQYSTWLHRVTQTAALMYLRKRRRYQREVSETSADIEGPSLLDRAATPANACAIASCHETLERTRAVVAGLGQRYPEIYWMRYGEGYTESEIARVLGLSLATVKTRAHRAKMAVAAAAASEAANEGVLDRASTGVLDGASKGLLDGANDHPRDGVPARRAA
jgi:RNA polymerase sigma-70 factor, ECF subfamily